MVSLGTVAARGRDNNLNLIRMLAALAVLVSHAWPMVYGAAAVQPLKRLTGETLGTHAVTVFFVLSGFLIAASFERSRSQGAYWTARIARLFPGLIVANLALVFLLGPLVTELAVARYFAAPGTWSFLFGNSAIIRPVFPLPGVFEGNPHPTVHGSIWTLRYELACYGLVALLGAVGLLRAPRLLLGLSALGYLGFWLIASRVALPNLLQWFGLLSFPFLLGVLAWLWRAQIPLSLWGVLGLGALAFAAGGGPAGPQLQVLAIAYGALWLSYVPGGWIRGYNRLGDYSYGTYVYAFPLQGLVVWLFGPTSPGLHCLLAVGPTLLCAVLSWHLIERPALAFGRRRARREAAGMRPPEMPASEARTSGTGVSEAGGPERGTPEMRAAEIPAPENRGDENREAEERAPDPRGSAAPAKAEGPAL